MAGEFPLLCRAVTVVLAGVCPVVVDEVVVISVGRVGVCPVVDEVVVIRVGRVGVCPVVDELVVISVGRVGVELVVIAIAS